VKGVVARLSAYSLEKKDRQARPDGHEVMSVMAKPLSDDDIGDTRPGTRRSKVQCLQEVANRLCTLSEMFVNNPKVR